MQADAINKGIHLSLFIFRVTNLRLRGNQFIGVQDQSISPHHTWIIQD